MSPSNCKHFSVYTGILLLIGILQNVQGAVIYSTINQRELSVGDRIYFTVTAMVPQGATIVPPDPGTGFGSMVVKEWNNRKFPRTRADSLVFEYALTTYKAENCTIPSLPYVLQTGSSSDTLRTGSIPLKIIPLLTTDSADIMGLKPQQVTGSRPLLWLWLLVAAAAVVAAAFGARTFIAKKRKTPPPPPPKPPYEEAIEALAALEEKKYLQKGMIREQVFELSEILKRYIERRFGVNAAEFTTEEMLAWLGVSSLDKENRSLLEWFFRATDPVKFARFTPDRDTIERFGTEVRSFLEATRPRPEPGKEETAASSPAKNGGGAV
jgi:hypothetical protein